MIQVSFNSGTAFLIDDIPTWKVTPQLKVNLLSDTEQGLTGIETRRLTGDTLRCSLSFTCILNGDTALTNLRNSLQALGDNAVLCPLWPAMFLAGETPPMASSWYVAIGDNAAPTIYPAADLPLTRPACPLMVGILSKRPSPTLIVDNLAQVEYEFTENTAFALTPPSFSPPAGLDAANGTRPIYPFPHNWHNKQSTIGSAQDVERKDIGPNRETSDAYYTQLARRGDSKQSTLYQNSDVWNLLSFFQQVGINNFWLQVGLSDAVLTADVGATDTTLTVDNTVNIGNNAVYAVADFVNRALVSVSSLTAPHTITLTGAIGTAFSAQSARLESLIIARFSGSTLTMSFRAPGWASVSLQFTEVPYEAIGASGETIGTTFGPMPTLGYLYLFTIQYPGGSEVFRFTNFERDVSDGVNTWTNVDINHEQITETDILDRQSVTLHSRNFIGNPLALMVPFTIEFPLLVEIIEATINTGTNVATAIQTWFNGEVSTCETDGPYIDAPAKSLNYIFDRNIPRRLYQQNCNWKLFEPACTMLAVNFTWTAKVFNYDGQSVLTLDTIASTNGATLTANFFAGGYVIIGSGTTAQYRDITASSVVGGGEMTLTLATPITGSPAVNTGVTFFPDCDGLPATCKNKFNNFVNFGGFPYIPVVNPTLLQTQSINAGKKS